MLLDSEATSTVQTVCYRHQEATYKRSCVCENITCHVQEPI